MFNKEANDLVMTMGCRLIQCGTSTFSSFRFWESIQFGAYGE